jgi:hypothetical protein
VKKYVFPKWIFLTMHMYHLHKQSEFKVRVTVFNATFNNISFMSWRSVCTTTCAISAYHHWCCEFKSCSWRGVLDRTLCDKVCQWFAIGWWFLPSINWSPSNIRINFFLILLWKFVPPHDLQVFSNFLEYYRNSTVFNKSHNFIT